MDAAKQRSLSRLATRSTVNHLLPTSSKERPAWRKGPRHRATLFEEGTPLPGAGNSGLEAQLPPLSRPLHGEVRPVHQLLQTQVGRLAPFKDGTHDTRRQEGQG